MLIGISCGTCSYLGCKASSHIFFFYANPNHVWAHSRGMESVNDVIHEWYTYTAIPLIVVPGERPKLQRLLPAMSACNPFHIFSFPHVIVGMQIANGGLATYVVWTVPYSGFTDPSFLYALLPNMQEQTGKEHSIIFRNAVKFCEFWPWMLRPRCWCRQNQQVRITSSFLSFHQSCSVKQSIGCDIIAL